MYRLWAIATAAREWHTPPSIVARLLDSDPEQLDLACIPLLRYAEAYSAYRRGNKHELAAWSSNPMMREVELNDFAAAARALGHEG